MLRDKNSISGYSLEGLRNLLYETILNGNLPYDSELGCMYFYSVVDELATLNADKRMNDSIYERFKKNLNNYENFNNSLSIYYYLYLADYFEITKINIDKNLYERFDLLDLNLSDTYLKLYYFVSLNILSKDESDYLYEYYDALYSEDGFGMYMSNSMNNINYGYYVLLNEIISNEHQSDMFPNIEEGYFSETASLITESNLKLYIMSLLQFKKNGAINKNLKDEVIDRINNRGAEFEFHMLYYSFLVVKRFDLESEILLYDYLNEAYLLDNLSNYLREKDLYMALKCLDILSLYYPNCELLYDYHSDIQNLFHIYFTDESVQHDLVNYLIILKNVETRLSFLKSTDISTFSSLIQPTEIDNLLIVTYNGYNSIIDYYDYYIFSSANTDVSESFYIFR